MTAHAIPTPRPSSTPLPSLGICHGCRDVGDFGNRRPFVVSRLLDKHRAVGQLSLPPKV